jgi:uncharacterized cupredoxin-like copper-binding protein
MHARSKVPRVVAVLSAAALLVVAGCGDDSSSRSTEQAARAGSSPESSPIAATVDEYGITLARATASSGRVSFAIHNNGRIAHEFVVIKSDLAPASLPTNGGKMDEEGAGDKVDEVEGLAPGKSATLSVNLTPGRYVLVCNLPGHYKQGMHASVTVR